MSTDKLHIANEMRELDRKNRDFYDELTDEERKKFSTFLMLRWGSAVQGDSMFQQYYVQSMNEQVNKYFFDLNKHPKLQWLLLTCVSPGMGDHRHEWIGFKGKTAKSKRVKLFADLYPEKKMDELELLDKVTTDEELKDQLRNLGWEDKKIKEAFK
jgi:hypothetical protein